MRQNSKVRDISLMALFSALTAIGAFITIPIPPVPFTLQIFLRFLLEHCLVPNEASSVLEYMYCLDYADFRSLPKVQDYPISSSQPSDILPDLFWEHGCVER